MCACPSAFAGTTRWKIPYAIALTTRCRADRTFRLLILPDGQITDFPVQPSLQKYSASRFTQFTFRTPAVPLPQRGVSRSSRTLGAGCGGRGSVRARDVIAGRVLARERSNGALMNGADADGEVVWS